MCKFCDLEFGDSCCWAREGNIRQCKFVDNKSEISINSKDKTIPKSVRDLKVFSMNPMSAARHASQ